MMLLKQIYNECWLSGYLGTCLECHLQADTQHQDQGGLVAPGQKANVIEALESHMKASTVKLNARSSRLESTHSTEACSPLEISHFAGGFHALHIV